MSGGSPYAGRSTVGSGSSYAGRGARTGTSPAPTPKKQGGGGILGIPGKILGDLETAAVNSPGGVYLAGKAAAHDTAAASAKAARAVGLKPKGYAAKVENQPSQLLPIGKQTVHGLGQDIHHPLRHPGMTLLDALAVASLGAGSIARGAAVAGKVGEGARASEIAAAAVRAPKPGVRVLRAGPIEVTKPASRSALTRSVTRQVDTLRNRFPDAHLPVQSQYARVGREVARQRTHEYRLLTTPFEELKYAGRRIHPNSPRGRALRAVAEGTPLETVVRTATHDLANAKDKFTRKQLQREIRIAMDARKYVNNETLPNGDVVPRLGDPKLQEVFDQAKAASHLEDQRMLATGQITPGQIQTGIQGAGRIHAGAHYVEPTSARLGVPSQALLRQRSEVERLQKVYDRSVAREAKAPKGSMVHRFSDQIPPENIYYRGTKPGGKRVVTGVPGWDKHLFVTATEADAKLYGPNIERVAFTPEAKILRYGTPEWDKIAVPHSVSGWPSKTLQRAKKAGYDAVHFKDQGAFGTVVLNEKAVIRNYETGEAAGKSARSSISERLGGALSVQKDKLARMEKAAAKHVQPTGLVGAEDFNHGQFHVGQETKRKAFSVGKQPVVGSANTVGIPRTPGRLTHALTGSSIHRGGLRHDVPALVAENALESERHAALLRARDFFAEHSQDTPEGIKRPVPIRMDELKNTPFPEPVKALQDAYRNGGSLDKNQTSLLGLTYDTLRDRVFPKAEDIGFPQINAGDVPAVPGVKWIDERLLGGLNRPRPLASALQAPGLRHTASFVDAVNNATKLSILYLKPAYAVPNMLGNGFLNLTQQGIYAPTNLARSVRLAKTIGPENARLVDRLMGEGISSVLGGPDGRGIVSRATQAGSAFWSKPVDLPFRRSSFLFEARKAGYGDKGGIQRLLHDEKHAQDLETVTQRATQAIIDYGDLTPVEQDIIRRVIFFYPWLKGSVKYAKTYLSEHPQQAAVLGAVGEQGKQAQESQLGPVPPFAEGLFKVGQRGATPLVSNPTAAGILGQPADLAAIASAALSGHVPRGREVSSLLTPFFGAGQTALSGYDTFTGRPVQPNLRTFLSALTAGQPIPTLASRLRHDQSQRMFPLSKRDALLQFLLGGIAPRPVDQAKLNSAAVKAYGPRR